MKEDRLRQDKAEIHNLDDLIDARSGKRSHLAADVDEFGMEVEIPDEVDAGEALTFPHPKHVHPEPSELEENAEDEDWEIAQDIQPSDYEYRYDEALDTHATDDMDQVLSEEVHHMGDIEEGYPVDRPTTEMPEGQFVPDEESAG